MENLDALTEVVNESKGTLASAAKTIRSLIVARNNALAAANPVVVLTVTEQSDIDNKVKALTADMNLARVDAEASIAEANATPVLPPKPVPPTPVVRPAV